MPWPEVLKYCKKLKSPGEIWSSNWQYVYTDRPATARIRRNHEKIQLTIYHLEVVILLFRLIIIIIITLNFFLV
jgi:hypothetical protein